MKLVDFLDIPGNRAAFPEQRLQRWTNNAWLCEIHQEDLVVADGFRQIGWDILWDYDFKTFNQNPNAIWFDDSLEKPGLPSERIKIVFCPLCESAMRLSQQARHPAKKRKGKKSKKYDREESSGE
ncbi:hypothetical protein [Lignipirellula cremea]|uniref:Uncharacterized protein n=1 Tax=Lignipirellula cremea TaxID=2528010 RepID=A0A518DV68_9BACT|nr:hypothetical protein [Lignipirellula cremea]QDU95736.1 hypothetical protein Pla8534_35530 [Lignipirellula cremea]